MQMTMHKHNDTSHTFPISVTKLVRQQSILFFIIRTIDMQNGYVQKITLGGRSAHDLKIDGLSGCCLMFFKTIYAVQRSKIIRNRNNCRTRASGQGDQLFSYVPEIDAGKRLKRILRFLFLNIRHHVLI